MKVHLVEDGIKIGPDNVYVIPPAIYMTVEDGHLVLLPKHGRAGHKSRRWCCYLHKASWLPAESPITTIVKNGIIHPLVQG